MNAQENIIWYNIGVDSPISPDAPMPELPSIPRGALVAIEGRAPIWRYAFAFHALHGSAAGAIATYHPKIGLVIVASHSPNYKAGTVLDVNPI